MTLIALGLLLLVLLKYLPNAEARAKPFSLGTVEMFISSSLYDFTPFTLHLLHY